MWVVKWVVIAVTNIKPPFHDLYNIAGQFDTKIYD